MVQVTKMWNYKVHNMKGRSGAMQLLPENIKVYYFARDHVEPYVEVGQV